MAQSQQKSAQRGLQGKGMIVSAAKRGLTWKILGAGIGLKVPGGLYTRRNILRRLSLVHRQDGWI